MLDATAVPARRDAQRQGSPACGNACRTSLPHARALHGNRCHSAKLAASCHCGAQQDGLWLVYNDEGQLKTESGAPIAAGVHGARGGPAQRGRQVGTPACRAPVRAPARPPTLASAPCCVPLPTHRRAWGCLHFHATRDAGGPAGGRRAGRPGGGARVRGRLPRHAQLQRFPMVPRPVGLRHQPRSHPRQHRRRLAGVARLRAAGAARRAARVLPTAQGDAEGRRRARHFG